jgi:hypothetical protein
MTLTSEQRCLCIGQGNSIDHTQKFPLEPVLFYVRDAS